MTLSARLAAEWADGRDIAQFTPGSSQSAHWRCGNGHEWDAVISSRARGAGCPVCTGRRVLAGFNDLATTHPEIAADWADEARSAVEVSAGSRYEAQWRCAKGHEWTAPVRRRTSAGTGCPVCTNKATYAGVNDLATTHPSIAAEWNDSRPVSEVTPGSNYKAQWTCIACGHQWKARVVDRTRNGHGCPACAGRVSRPGITDLATTHSALAAELVDQSLANVLTAGSNQEVEWRCSAGHVWGAMVYNRTYGQSGCPICANKAALPGYNDLVTTHPGLAAEWSAKNEIQPTEVTFGSNYAALWVCDKNHEWRASVYSRASGNGCLTCARQKFSSLFEQEVADYISSIVPTQTVVQPARGIVKGHELDIYLPDLGIAIEANGVYWHSEAAGKKPGYHKEKADACAAAGIRLIQVWEDDWKVRRGVVEKMLAHKLGASQLPLVPARKTTPASISQSEAQAFLAQNHIQGYASGSHYLALQSAGQTVAVMVLKKTGQPGILRLERYATSARVPGGQSKLIRHAERSLPDWQKLVTFADREVSDGHLYEASGWVRDGELAPDYRYLYGGERRHKFGFRLKRFRTDPKLQYVDGYSERELALLNRIPRIWDSGKVRYVYHRAAEWRRK